MAVSSVMKQIKMVICVNSWLKVFRNSVMYKSVGMGIMHFDFNSIFWKVY